MNYIIRVRFGNEEHRVTDFITPSHPQVQSLVSHIGHNVQACYDWVCENVKYPTTSDRHHMSAFGGPFPIGYPRISMTVDEFWQFPCETLGWGKPIEDCDGSSILLCSMLRCFVPSSDVYVGIGGYNSIDHAWVRYKSGGSWYVLESTLDEPFPMYSLVENSPYNLYCYFNDKEAVEVVPGSFASICTKNRKKNHNMTARSVYQLLSIVRKRQTLTR